MENPMPTNLWQRYRQYLCVSPSIDLTVDISRMKFGDDFFAKTKPLIEKAFANMVKVEKGDIVNPDENRMVGHYWLRDAGLAPTPELRGAIADTLSRMKKFAADVHSGAIKPQRAPKFTDLLVIGIGGSALGPQLVADALGDVATDKMKVHFFDNTDPEGIDRVLCTIGNRLPSTLAVVISKSGGTAETRNGMLLAASAFRRMGLDFGPHAVAVTGEGSKLDGVAVKEKWITRFPMWDWIGGRVSETSAVGLLPAVLQGLDIDGLLAGAAACDKVTRVYKTEANPAALLALMWYHATKGLGEKDMVILPYKDRLLLLSRYLQQLVMESLGKATDLEGKPVAQGIAVYGNKGSTDQHAYVQQLREGVNNFYATFIKVTEDGGATEEVDPGTTAGDYLQGFLLGTRGALYDSNRESITITVPRVDPFHLGVLIALYERAVGFYAILVNINAYHQPGVEAGKKAAAAVLEVQGKVMAKLGSAPQTAEQLAAAIGSPESVETVFHVLNHLAANKRIQSTAGADVFEAKFNK
jgi:glucose-6-phosphate isomerase